VPEPLRLSFAPGLFVLVGPDTDPTSQLRDAVSDAAKAGHHTVSAVIEPGREWAVGPLLDAGFHPGRQLLQLRCALPIEAHTTIVTRPFRPGSPDEVAWLAVNNRAFHWHPEQSGWTLEQLHDHMREPWFDPDGFFLHEADGKIVGFCWTKVHVPTDHEPQPVGEIFVIGVDPAYHGRGLGRALTVVGLTHLSSLGIERGMLYVESDNAAALQMYDRLGFREHHRLVWYSHPCAVESSVPTSEPASSEAVS